MSAIVAITRAVTWVFPSLNSTQAPELSAPQMEGGLGDLMSLRRHLGGVHVPATAWQQMAGVGWAAVDCAACRNLT